MSHVIYRFIAEQMYFWTTCGWSRDHRPARKYVTKAEAQGVFERMNRAGVRCMLAPLRSLERRAG
jgi:hypothetical protein